MSGVTAGVEAEVGEEVSRVVGAHDAVASRCVLAVGARDVCSKTVDGREVEESKR